MKTYSLLLLFVLFLISCSINNTDIPTIYFNNDSKLTFSIDCKYIPLETTDSCLISGIEDVKIINNKIFIIDERNKGLYVFSDTGNYITQIGNYGTGPGEYIMPTRFHINERERLIIIFDFKQVKMLVYNLDSYKYLYSFKSNPSYDCAFLIDNNIAWLKLTGYKTDQREKYYLKITDMRLNERGYYIPASLTTGYSIGIGKRFHTYLDQAYFSVQFSPTIYRITQDQVEPVYNVSFENLQFPSKDWLKLKLDNDNNYTRELLNSQYISAYNINESSEYLAATLYANGRNAYIGFHNKKTNLSILFTAEEFMKKSNLYGCSPIKGCFNDYFITTLFMHELKNNNMNDFELESIIKNKSSEDNPVVCLFKIEFK